MSSQPWTLILIMAGLTLATRALPFVIFSKGAGHPLLDYLGRYLPPAIMLILVLHALSRARPLTSDLEMNMGPDGLPLLAASLVVATLHLWRRNSLLSIGAGTLAYMLMLQL